MRLRRLRSTCISTQSDQPSHGTLWVVKDQTFHQANSENSDQPKLRLTLISPFMPKRLFYLNSLDRSISYIRGVWLDFLLLPCLKENFELNANSVDPDQMPGSSATDLGLHCLPMSHL